MKAFNVLALFYVFVSVALAVPVPVREGKQRAVDTPVNSRPSTPDIGSRPSTPDIGSRPSTPTPELPLSHPPLPGRTGYHTVNGITTAYYGDDDIPGHMRHVQRNQASHPENLNPMKLADHEEKIQNGRNALHRIPSRGEDELVRDEKMPKMFRNPNHATTTTVEYHPRHESNKEGGMLSGVQRAMKNGGKGARGQLRPNPGWLPLDPSQRRGHEAPAIMTSQPDGVKDKHDDRNKHDNKNKNDDKNNKASGSKVSGSKASGSKASGSKVSGSKASGSKASDSKTKPEAKVEPPKHNSEGHTPVTGTGITLRFRPPKDQDQAPKTPAPKRDPKRAAGSGTYLRPGTPPPPPGHVFKGTNEERPERASHHGAPAPPSNSHQRHPPRPQNQAHHEKMQKEEAAKKAAQGHGGHSRPQYAGTVPHGVDSARYHSNLERFNQNHPHTPGVGNGHGRPAEAPARLGTHHTNQPSTSHHGASTSHNPPAHGAHHPAPAPHTNLAHRPAAPHSPPQTPTPSSKKKNGKK